MKVIHIIPYVGKAQGGPVFSLMDYTRALGNAGCHVTVAAAPRVADGPAPVFDPGIELLTAKDPRLGNFRFTPGFARSLANHAEYDVVHSHGLWTYASVMADRLARLKDIPHVITPCGMLQPDALTRSRLKKLLCRKIFQERILERATCIHAKSQAEAAAIRSFGARAPLGVIPNPVAPPGETLHPDRVATWKDNHGLDGNRIVLFVGRIHPVKGLARLVEAWAANRQYADGWRLILAGPDEDNYQKELEAQIQQAGCSDDIHFLGSLDSAEKWLALAAADLFVMPSDFENFGSAVAEALAAGVPVITTDGTPWDELPRAGAGWFVGRTAEALGAALREAWRIPDGQRAEMGRRAKRIGRRFDSVAVGCQLLDLYLWIKGQTACPDFVRLAAATGRRVKAEETEEQSACPRI